MMVRLKPQDTCEPHKGVRVLLLLLSDVGLVVRKGGEFYIKAGDKSARLDMMATYCGYHADMVEDIA